MSTIDLNGVLSDLEPEWSTIKDVTEIETTLKEAVQARRAGRVWNMPPRVKEVADSLYESRRAELAAAPGIPQMSRANHHKHRDIKPSVTTASSKSANGSKASDSKRVTSPIDMELEAIARKTRCRTPEIARSVDNALMHLLGDLLRPPPPPPPPLEVPQTAEDEDMPETAYDEDSGAEDDVETPQHEIPALTMIDPRRLAAAAEQEQQRLMALAAGHAPSAKMVPKPSAPAGYASKSIPSHYGAGAGFFDDDVEPEDEDDDEMPYELMHLDAASHHASSTAAAPGRPKSKPPQKRPKYPPSAGKGLLQQPVHRAAAAQKSTGQYANGASSLPAGSAVALVQATEVSATGKLYTPPSAKPFACPTPGCNARYKQANGLKYHRLKGKCVTTEVVQQAIGKEAKPFVCHDIACGKRYKNLNGLRYHYQHSGSHGIIGSQLLAAGTHPPPQRGAGSINGDMSMDREGSYDSSGSGGY